jgi:hypothetical protein
MASAVQSDRSPKVTPIRLISPDLKSWIKNCIVPILVREYLATQQIQIVSERDEVLESDVTTAIAARVSH